MKRLFSYTTVLLLIANALYAQEINLGIHFNPTLTIPVVDQNSFHNTEIKVSYAKFGTNIGFNLKYQIHRLNIETGLNVIQKSIKFKQSDFGGLLGSGSYFHAVSRSTSLEIPLLFAYTIHEHSRSKKYKVDAIGGLAYEMYSADGYSGTTHIITNGKSNSVTTTAVLPQPFTSNSWLNIVVGSQIRTVVRKVGLFEYGLTYHFPLKRNNGYYIESSLVNNVNITESFYGAFSPRLSYLNIKLCYYILSMNKEFKRIRYKNPERF